MRGGTPLSVVNTLRMDTKYAALLAPFKVCQPPRRTLTAEMSLRALDFRNDFFRLCAFKSK